jgi:hypothetical protein
MESGLNQGRGDMRRVRIAIVVAGVLIVAGALLDDAGYAWPAVAAIVAAIPAWLWACALWARAKGWPAWLGLLLGVFHVFGAIVLALLPDRRRTGSVDAGGGLVGATTGSGEERLAAKVRAAFAIGAYVVSLLLLTVVASQVVMVLKVFPPEVLAQYGEPSMFTQAAMAQTARWPWWLGGSAVLSLAAAAYAWRRLRSAESRNLVLVLLAFFNVAIALNFVMAIVQGYLISPHYAEPAQIEEADGE